jgi:hypothetical protein
MWNTVSQNITLTLSNTIKQKYNNINTKINQLKNEQCNNTHRTTHTFYKRVENLSNVAFTYDETQLLNKGLKYNLHHKRKNWIETLAMETE